MIKLKVNITNDQQTIKVPSGLRLLIRRCCHAVLTNEGMLESAEVSISFTDNKGIRELNAKHRGKDAVTDVLSFPLSSEQNKYEKNPETGAIMYGDIVISIEKAIEQAAVYDHTIQREVAFLTVHAMYHLLGYDHEKGGIQAVHMREKEEQVLYKVGLPRGASYTMYDED